MNQTTTKQRRESPFGVRLTSDDRARLVQLAASRGLTLGATVKAALRAMEETTRG